MHTVLIATLLWSVYVHDRELRGPDCDSTRSVYVHGRDLRGPDRDCTRSVFIHDVYDFCRGRHRSPAQQAKSALRQELFWIAKSMPKTVAASPSEPVVFIVAPDPAAAQETDNLPETVPAPHSNFDAETIAELKGKPEKRSRLPTDATGHCRGKRRKRTPKSSDCNSICSSSAQPT